MWAMGFTLNMITLLALTLAVGIVIDDAIVVLENIYRLIEEKGLPPAAGRRRGHARDRPGRPGHDALADRGVPAGGVHGRHRRALPEELRPHDGVRHRRVALRERTRSRRCWRPAGSSMRPDGGPDGSKESRVFGWIERAYDRALRWSMAHRWVVVLACVAALLSVVPLFIFGGKDFLPENDESQFEVNLRAPEGTTVEQTALIAARVSREISGMPGVAYTIVAGRRRRAAHREPRQDLRQAPPGGRAEPGPVPDHGRGPHARAAAIRGRRAPDQRLARWPPSRAAAWRTRRSPVRRHRAPICGSSAVLRAPGRRARADAGRGRRRTRRSSSASPSSP